MALGAEHIAKSQHAKSPQILVWDPVVRLGHWLLVMMFFVAYFTDDELLTVHSWAGYGVGVYVVIRFIWGFAGPEHARFVDFAYGPGEAVRYLRDLLRFKAKRHIGHSPAGGLMVVALLVALTGTTVSGVALLAVEENAGPLAPWLGGGVVVNARPRLLEDARASKREEEREKSRGRDREEEKGEALEEIHEFFSNLTLVLVGAHIGGVVLASVVHRENLVLAMVTGRKRLD